MTITDYEEFENYAYGMETVVEEHPIDKGRWTTYFEQVVKDKEGKYWLLEWESGSTEYQDIDFSVEVTEVFPLEVTQTVYVTKEKYNDKHTT
jgi:hypothetical protein